MQIKQFKQNALRQVDAFWSNDPLETQCFVTGDEVTHQYDGFAYGIVVAVIDETITVLWSRVPSLDYIDDMAMIQQDIKTTPRSLKLGWSVEMT